MELRATLAPHPQTPAPAVRVIDVCVQRDATRLRVDFVLDGDLAGLRVPPAGPTRPGARLWEHTCFEVFVAAAGAASYHELNLAPSGAWAAHAFRGYRDGGPLADERAAPALAVRRTAQTLALEASVALAALSPSYVEARLRLGVSAVVEEASGGLSYWALHHPSARPDFHHADAFVLVLEPPPARW